jgi:ABC-2 type transport system ATP-binding protein
MKNKLQLLCCLIRQPKVILLDEPLSSFDIIVSHDIKERLVEMKHNHIILMSTHILQLATDVSDEILLLKNGVLTGFVWKGYQREVYEKRLMDALNEEDEVG